MADRKNGAIELRGIPWAGETEVTGVWNGTPFDISTKLGLLRIRGENWSENRALVETLYYRARFNKHMSLPEFPDNGPKVMRWGVRRT